MVNSTQVTLQYAARLSQHVQVVYSHQLNASVYEQLPPDSDYTRPATDEVYKRSGNPGVYWPQLVILVLVFLDF